MPQVYDSLIVKNTHHISDYLSTEILTKNNLTQVNEFLPNINFVNEHFNNFLINHLDKLF